MHAALDDPNVFKVASMKSAQIAWTDGVLNNYIGRRIDIDPCPMIIMFAKDKAAKEYNDEKFTPMVEATPRLAAKIPVTKKRDKDNRSEFKQFPGGFLKFVGSNSPSSVKSTPAPVVCIEEPDDCNDNVRDQGDTITLLEERTKTFARRKVVFGGTPTIEGVSRIEAAYKLSDQRKFFVPCHLCDEDHVLEWANVRWDDDPEQQHEVFGKAKPATAYYVCPHCGGVWNDTEKNRNVRLGQWRATASFHGVAGFYINELYSPFPGSMLAKLAEKYLTAKHALDQGDDTKMRAFVNNTEGLPYAYKTDMPDIAALKERAEDYAEFTAPAGGLILTAGVDVQHDRIAVVIRAWGRGEESWLVYWGEIYGQVVVPGQGAWVDLDALLSRRFQSAYGASLIIRAVTIDSSDGQTADAVYSFVRSRQARGFMAGKGGSIGDAREIFSVPKPSVDADKKQKAYKYGLRPFIVGTERAKDLLLAHDAGAGRIRLTGNGPGRVHWYKSVRPDYYEQITSEVKAPHRSIRNRKVWQKKSGVRNEALDCEVYALHAARSLKIHLLKNGFWDDLERQLRQAQIFDAVPVEPLAQEASEEPAVQTSAPAPQAVPQPAPKPPAPPPPPAPTRAQPLPRPGGFSAKNW